MARHPHPPNGTRFFARLSAAALECPKCGHVHLIGGRGSPTKKAWDPQTSRFTCTQCRKVYVLGILAWPAAVGSLGRGPRATLPRDQVPNERQLAQLRAEQGPGGIWLPDERRIDRYRAEESNMTSDEDEQEGDEDATD